MRKTIIALSFIALLCFCVVFSGQTVTVYSNTKKTIIIDAGHGNPDGGAVASDGTVEAELNLSISKRLEQLLKNAGFNCIMIRSDENSIFSEGNTIHAKKVSDIRNRVKTANSNPDAFVVSIHMNTYHDTSVKGAQFFYKPSSDISKDIAIELQSAVNNKFQPESNKKAKPTSANIYFLNHIKNDYILAECGFLTNAEDLKMLKSEEFQREFSALLAEVIIFKFSGSD